MDYKAIRNKLGTFSYNSLVLELLKILQELEKQKTPTPFWHPLLLLKWTLEFSENKYPSKTATREDIVKLLKKFDDLEMSHSTFNLKRNNGQVVKFLTIIAYQQFMYQENASWYSFARQLLLFERINGRYDIASSFHKKTGLTIEEYLKILLIIFLSVFHPEIIKVGYYGYISYNILQLIETTYGKEKLNMFLSIFSISRDNIHEVLKNDTRQLKNYNLQPFEPSIFTRKPFFFYTDKYIIPHKSILNHTINYFINSVLND